MKAQQSNVKDITGKRLKRPQQRTIRDTFASVTPYENTSKRRKEITDSTTHYLTRDMVPIYTVNRRDFKKLDAGQEISATFAELFLLDRHP